MNDFQEAEVQEMNGCTTQNIVLRGALAEIYYLLKDRNSRAIGDAMFLIENLFPEVKNYKSKQREIKRLSEPDSKPRLSVEGGRVEACGI